MIPGADRPLSKVEARDVARAFVAATKPASLLVETPAGPVLLVTDPAAAEQALAQGAAIMTPAELVELLTLAPDDRGAALAVAAQVKACDGGAKLTEVAPYDERWRPPIPDHAPPLRMPLGELARLRAERDGGKATKPAQKLSAQPMLAVGGEARPTGRRRGRRTG